MNSHSEGTIITVIISSHSQQSYSFATMSAVSAVLKKLPKKSPIMNYEQLLSLVFSCFHGQKINLIFFEDSLASALKICLI